MVKMYAYGEANPLAHTLEQLQFSRCLLTFCALLARLSPVNCSCSTAQVSASLGARSADFKVCASAKGDTSRNFKNRSLGHRESTLKGVACHNKIPDLNFHEL
jgi:hypothetical protein